MNEETKVPNMTRHEQSPDKSIQGNTAPVLRGGDWQFVERAGLYIGVIAIVFASMSIMGFFWAYSEMQEAKADARAAKNRADAAMLRTEGFTRALIAKGIDPYPHLQGEDP